MKTTYLSQLLKEQHFIAKIGRVRALARTLESLRDEKVKSAFLLSMNNFKLVHKNISLTRELDKLLTAERKRLSSEHDFTLPEKPFCVVVLTVNNGLDFRYEYNLQSIFNQDYANYKVVVIDDASTDHTSELIAEYLRENPVPQKVHLIRNEQRTSAIPNIYRAATEYCSPGDILALVDGDDELLGVNVFKVLNSVYTRKGLEVLYSNFIVNRVGQAAAYKGWSTAYSAEEKRLNKYRSSLDSIEGTRMMHMRTFNVSTFLKMQPSDMQDDEGRWFLSAYDEVIFPQVLELSCGRNDFIDEILYLYNYATGTNDVDLYPGLNLSILKEILKRQKHTCP